MSDKVTLAEFFLVLVKDPKTKELGPDYWKFLDGIALPTIKKIGKQ